MSYRTKPKQKPGGVERCCGCGNQVPVTGDVEHILDRGIPMGIKKYWCANCGYYLTTADQDRHFPGPQWVDNRNLPRDKDIQQTGDNENDG